MYLVYLFDITRYTRTGGELVLPDSMLIHFDQCDSYLDGEIWYKKRRKRKKERKKGRKKKERKRKKGGKENKNDKTNNEQSGSNL